MSRHPPTAHRKSERELFVAALDCGSLAERRRFLDSACGEDAALRDRLEALLDETTRIGTFMAGPAVREGGTSEARRSALKELPESGEHLGDRIGPYCLVDFIGEGGGGSVYLAEQAEPVRRTVALKILKLGMDTKSVIARFEAERQTLAMMDHPNIARVLDAGATREGRPYFVMDHVPGAPITDYCDANTLTLGERIGIFVKVCRAVEHAHRKGIIHRDLKPSNILVTEQDGEAVPKIIDFGVAKAVDPNAAGAGAVTHVEAIIGTPSYMSPEQAERDIDIDTRSDVYSLGVLLHELLTGMTPLDRGKMSRAGFEEVRRALRETVLARPSLRLQECPVEDRPMILHDRDTTMERLSGQLRGDLDWVVMKCLERERDRRFGSASELARDLERYLAGEPVTARPPSTAYRVRKFVRRHRPAVVASGVVLLMLVAAAAIGTALAIRATRAERDMREAHKTQSQLRAEAEGDRELALKSAAIARLHEYVADINVSQIALTEGNMAKALQLLGHHSEVPVGAADLRGFEWRLLAGRCLGDQHRTLVRQSDPIESLAYSPEGDYLAIGTREELTIWDVSAGQPVTVLPGSVTSVAFFPDGERIAVASRHGVWVYDLDSPDPVIELREHGGALAISADGGLLATSDRRGVTVWDTQSWHRWRQLPWASGPLAFAPDGETLATGSRDGITLWPLGANGEQRVLDDSPGRMLGMFSGGNSVAFSPDGAFVFAPQLSGLSRGEFSVGIWDAGSGAEIDTIPRLDAGGGHTAMISKLGLLGDGSLLATSSWDHSVGVWDVESRALRQTLHGHRGEVWAVALAPGGKFVASGSKDGEVKVWPTVQEAPDRSIEGRWEPLAYSDDSNYLAALNREGSIAIFNLHTREPVHTVDLSAEGARFDRHAVSVAGDLNVLAEGLPDGHVKVRRLDRDQELVFQVAPRRVELVLLSPDASTLLTAQGRGELLWWDLDAPTEPIARFEAAQAVFSDDGSTLAIVTRDGYAVIWDTATRSERCRIGHAGQAFGSRAALSADGTLIAMTHGFDDFENAISLWETGRGKRLGTLTGHKQGIWSVAFAPDGRTLATSSRDGTLRLWNVASRRELLSIGDPGMSLSHLLFSPDGQHLAGGTPAFRLPGEMRLFHAPPVEMLEEELGR